MSSTQFKFMIAFLVLMPVLLALVYRGDFTPELITRIIEDAGWWAPVVFVLIYILATVLFLPGAALTLLGGALFGPVLGTFCNLTGATLGAAIAFLISRYLASDWVAQRAEGKTRTLIEGVEREGWRFIAFVRLVPLFPFNLLNYALGLTRIGFWPYVIASYVFMLPAGIAYTYVGYAGKEAFAGGDDLVQKGLLALALLAVAGFLPGFIKRLRQQPPERD